MCLCDLLAYWLAKPPQQSVISYISIQKIHNVYVTLCAGYYVSLARCVASECGANCLFSRKPNSRRCIMLEEPDSAWCTRTVHINKLLLGCMCTHVFKYVITSLRQIKLLEWARRCSVLHYPLYSFTLCLTVSLMAWLIDVATARTSSSTTKTQGSPTCRQQTTFARVRSFAHATHFCACHTHTTSHKEYTRNT